MNLTPRPDSLFAILLRSPWWMSAAIAAAMVAVASAMNGAWVYYGAFAALPFIVIASIAAWRGFRTPSASRVDEALGNVRDMSWGTFAGVVEDALRNDGYTVSRLSGGEADFEAKKAGRIALVSCKRWKVASTGIKPLRDLHAAVLAREANDAIYVAAGAITEQARAFALKNRIRLIHGVELARWVPATAGKKRASS